MDNVVDDIERAGGFGGGRASFHHIRSDVAGIARAQMITATIKHKIAKPDHMVIYLLPHQNDIQLIKLTQVVRLCDRPSAGHIYMSTFAEWMSGKLWNEMNIHGKYLFILETGMGQLKADMELTMATVFNWLRPLHGTENTDWSLVAWVVSSTLKSPLVTNDFLQRMLPGPSPPRLEQIHITWTLPQNPPTYHKVGRMWYSEIGQVIREALNNDKTPGTFIIISGYSDARRIHKDVAEMEFLSLGPCSTLEHHQTAATNATGAGRIIHIDRATNVVPYLVGMRAVFVAPYLVDYTYDQYGVSVVEARIAMTEQEAMVAMVLGQCQERVPIHIFKPDDTDPGRKLKSATADRGYFHCGLLYLCPGTPPSALPRIMPKLHIMQDFSGCLRVACAGLLKDQNATLGFRDFSIYLGQETHPAALVLLESAAGLPKASEAARIRVELAMLIAHGPMSIMETYSHHTLNQHIQAEIAKGPHHRGLFSPKYAYRGQLWELLVVFQAYRLNKFLTRHSKRYQPLCDTVRVAMADFLIIRVDTWLQKLELSPIKPTFSRSTELTPNELLDLEKILVVALSDNMITTEVSTGRLLHTTRPGLKLQMANSGIDWAKFEQEHPEDFNLDEPSLEDLRIAEWVTLSRMPEGNSYKFSVYCSLHMETSHTGERIYDTVGSMGVRSLSVGKAKRYRNLIADGIVEYWERIFTVKMKRQAAQAGQAAQAAPRVDTGEEDVGQEDNVDV